MLRIARAFCPEVRHFESNDQAADALRRCVPRVFRGGLFLMALTAGPMAAIGVFNIGARALSKTGAEVLLAALVAAYPLTFLAFARAKLSRLVRDELLIQGYAICRQCGYSLRGQERPVCPECGTPFDGRMRRSPDEPIRYELLGAYAATGSPDLLWIEFLINVPPASVELGEFSLGPYWNCARFAVYLSPDGERRIMRGPTEAQPDQATTRVLFAVSNVGAAVLNTPQGQMPIPATEEMPARLAKLIGN